MLLSFSPVFSSALNYNNTRLFCASVYMTMFDLAADRISFESTWGGLFVCTLELSNGRRLCCTLCSWGSQ